MKKGILVVLALIMVLGLVGCGNANSNNVSIDELKGALDKEGVELDSFDFSENNDGFSFEAKGDNVLITGTADKSKNINKVKFENSGTDSSMFSSKTVFEQWYKDNVKNSDGDFGQMTMRELKSLIVALNCIDELQAFYSLFEKEDTFLLAVNTLLTKESSEIENWNITVSVLDSESVSDDTIIIEAAYNK